MVEHFGIDPVHFGIIMIFNLSIGAFTPPVGTVMLLVCNITQVSVGNFFKQSLPLLAALLLMLMLVTYIPAISLFGLIIKRRMKYSSGIITLKRFPVLLAICHGHFARRSWRHGFTTADASRCCCCCC